MAELEARTSLGAGAIAAFLASLCCLGPLALLALGIGGAWVGYLTALSTYQPIFAGLTLVFLALAFRKVYLVPQACEPGTQCDPRTALLSSIRCERKGMQNQHESCCVSQLLVNQKADIWRVT